MSGRVRLIPPQHLGSHAVEGESIRETVNGIVIDVDTSPWWRPTSTGVERRFYPWTSIGHMVIDPEEETTNEPF